LAVKRDYYEVLGLGSSCSTDEIKSAYRRLARQHHPDVNPGDSAAEARFKEINEAYEVLSSQEKRQRYDQFGHAGVNGGPGGAGDFGGFGGFGVGDIFDMFFGGGTREAGARGTRIQRGADLRYDLEITLEEAAFGAERAVEITKLETCTVCKGSGGKEGAKPETCSTCRGQGQVRSTQQTFLGSFSTVTTCPHCRGEGQVIKDPCPRCHGDGRERKSKTLAVKIPAGVDTGNRIRFTNEGEAGPNGGHPGDLYVVTVVRPHPVFERDGRDVACEISISIAKASLGGKVKVPTLDGEQEMYLPEGTQPGDVFRLAGKGIPEVGRSTRGDQHVVIRVATPTRLNDRQRRALQEFAAASGEEVGETGDGSFFEKIRNIFHGKKE
jgi:molecular chaperone DnaJ